VNETVRELARCGSDISKNHHHYTQLEDKVPPLCRRLTAPSGITEPQRQCKGCDADEATATGPGPDSADLRLSGRRRRLAFFSRTGRQVCVRQRHR